MRGGARRGGDWWLTRALRRLGQRRTPLPIEQSDAPGPIPEHLTVAASARRCVLQASPETVSALSPRRGSPHEVGGAVPVQVRGVGQGSHGAPLRAPSGLQSVPGPHTARLSLDRRRWE